MLAGDDICLHRLQRYRFHLRADSTTTRLKRWSKADADNLRSTTAEDMTTYAIALFHAQRGCCFHSGFRMSLAEDKSDPWRVLLERLDVTRPHIRGNVVLVATEFNATDHGARMSGGDGIGGGLTPQRIDEFLHGKAFRGTRQRVTKVFQRLREICPFPALERTDIYPTALV